MTTECTTERLEFERFRRQRVVGRFDGGELGSDGGGLLLRELALASIIESAGLAHGKGMQAYLTMMAVRLLELRRLLKTTGSIYLLQSNAELILGSGTGRPGSRCTFGWRGKSGLHRTTCRLTAGGCFREETSMESATENKPPRTSVRGKGEMVR